HIRVVTAIGSDRFGARVHHFDYVMSGGGDEQSHGSADTWLIVGYQDAHRLNFAEPSMPAPWNLLKKWRSRAAEKIASRGRIRRCLPLYFAGLKQLAPR